MRSETAGRSPINVHFKSMLSVVPVGDRCAVALKTSGMLKSDGDVRNCGS